ncbi:MAG: hypothetical protein PHI32_02960 [Dysgonamonadaceae bacterium]|nr:hypothetical protein [Dysgonamonadaceae bacterium]MDD4729068.1 hypothetical protein [Dysgonamonadaceae bacterium]
MNQEHTPESFFEEVMFPLFFNDEKHLMEVHNSSFAKQMKVSKTLKEEHPSKNNNEIRLIRLQKAINTEKPYGGTFVGYGAKEITRETSGQMTDLLDYQASKNEMYASWVGQALAIGISGGYVFLLNDDDILWKLFYGWKHYRKFLRQTPNLKDRQIETWNGNWLEHAVSEKFDLANPFIGFSIYPESVLGKLAIPTVSWSEMFFKLSKFMNQKEIIINAYSLSKKNKTLGFIKVLLHEVQKPIEYKHILFDFKDFKNEITEEDIVKFETFYNFSSACQMGTIGLKGLEPRGLRSFMPKGSMPFAQGNELNFEKEKSYFLYEIYQIWIMATLNKTQLLELASKTASLLHNLEGLDERGKKQLSTLSTETRESKNIKQFIENLAKILDVVKVEDKVIIREVVQETLAMPSDNYPLFITLIRFEYNYLKTKSF